MATTAQPPAPLQTAHVLADLSALFVAEPNAALHMVSGLALHPSTHDRRGSRALSIPDAPAVVRAKYTASRSSASTGSPAAIRSPEPAGVKSPASRTPLSSTAVKYGVSSASVGSEEDEDVDMRRARMLLRGFDARRKFSGDGGDVAALEEARRIVDGVEERFKSRAKAQ